MSGTESSGPKIKLKIAKPDDAMQVDPPAETPKPGAKNTKKNVGSGRSKTTGADDMDVDVPEMDDESKKPAGKNATGKSRAGRPAQGDGKSKNKRTKANHPPPAAAIPSSPLPDAPLAASTAELPDIVDGSLEENEDDAYGSDSEEGKKKPSKKNNNSKKNKPKARNTRNKPPKDTTVTDYDVSLLDEGDHSAGYQYATQLWDNVKAYFAEFTQDDIDSVTPKDNPNDSIMSIPRLGLHWTMSQSLDATGKPNPRRLMDQSTDGMLAGGMLDFNDRPETVSARILAALIEDHPVAADAFTIDDMDLSQQGDMSGDMPTDGDSNLQQQELIDQRVRYELRAVGLLEDADLAENPREDDEICAELRLLQQQLRQQISVNNKLKAKLHEKVLVAVEQRKEQRKRREQWLKQEKELLDILKTKYPRTDKEKDKEKKGK